MCCAHAPARSHNTSSLELVRRFRLRSPPPFIRSRGSASFLLAITQSRHEVQPIGAGRARARLRPAPSSVWLPPARVRRHRRWASQHEAGQPVLPDWRRAPAQGHASLAMGPRSEELVRRRARRPAAGLDTRSRASQRDGLVGQVRANSALLLLSSSSLSSLHLHLSLSSQPYVRRQSPQPLPIHTLDPFSSRANFTPTKQHHLALVLANRLTRNLVRQREWPWSS